jgi:hypothetical protein
VGHAALYSGKDVSVRCHRDLDSPAGIPFSSSHSIRYLISILPLSSKGVDR